VHIFQGQRVETVRQCSSAAQSRFRHTRLRRERESSQRMYIVCMYTPSTYISMNLSTCAYIFTMLPHSYCILYGNQVSMYVCMYVCRMSWNGRRGSSGMQIGAFLIGGDIYCMGRRAEERLRYVCTYV
jgi:hypothetical protein